MKDEGKQHRTLRLAVSTEELLSILHQLQKPGPLLDVVLIRLLMPLDPGPDLRLLLTPL